MITQDMCSQIDSADPETTRAAVKQILDSIDGIECSNPDQRQDWLDLLGEPPAGTNEWDLDRPFKCWKDSNGAEHVQGISTCGLVALGVWRMLNVDAPQLYSPYRSGAAVSEVVSIAKSMSAWRTSGTPNPGDVVVLIAPWEHVLTVYSFSPDDGVLVSVDGGQTDSQGQQAVKRCTRTWVQSGSKTTLGKSTVYGYVDVTQLSLKQKS